MSGGDVAAAAEVAASTIRAFVMEADSAVHVANVFARAAADTNAEVADMGEAMKYVAPVASAMGLTLEETAAAIGIMSDAGIKGGQAGTALRGSLSRLANPTKAMTDTMNALGVSFYDSEGNMLSLSAQVAVLQDAFVGLTQEQRNEALVTLYGQESLSGMLALIDAGPERLDELTQSFVESNGAAEEMANIMLDNLPGAIENLSGALETLGLSIYDNIKEPLKNVVSEAAGYVGQLQDAFNKGGFEGLVSAIGDVLAQAVTRIVEYAPAFVEASVSIITSLVSGITENADVLGASAVELIGVLASGIAEVSVSLVESGLQIVLSLLQGIQESGTEGMGTAALDLITRLITAFTEALPQIATVGAEILTNLAMGISSGAPDFIAQAMPLITDFTANLRTSAGQLVDAGINLLINLTAGLVAALPDLIAYVPQIVINIAGIINDNAPKLLACAVTLIGQLIQGIISAIPDLIANAGKIVEAIFSVIQAVNWMKLGSNIMDLLKNGISKMKDSIGQAAKSLAEKAKEVIKNTDWAALGKTIITFLKNGVTSMMGMFGSAAKSIATNGFNLIKGIDWGGLGRTVLTFVVNGIKAVGSLLLSALKTAGTSALNAFKNIDWGGVGRAVINGIVAGVTGAASALYNSLRTLASSALSAAKRALGINSPSRVFKDEIGRQISLGLAEGISSSASAAVGAVQDMADELASVEFANPEIGVDFDGDTPDFDIDPPDDPYFDAIIERAHGTVATSNAKTATAISASGASNHTAGQSEDKVSATNPTEEKPKYVEATITLDGKTVGRGLTPYIEKEIAWKEK